jgi:hypothetical protein
MNIRTLKANEIECRIGSLKNNGLSLLLYKDARADMKILDETFGFDGWERSHEVIDGKLFCTVKVWSEKRSCWISKQDVGTESNAEKEKGQVSDSFKRACVNLGIGRELYTAPFIWINGNFDKYVKFDVKEIAYNEDREIKDLVIVDSEGNIVYEFKNGEQVKTKKPKYTKDKFVKDEKSNLEKVYDLAEKKGYTHEKVNRHILSKGFDINNFTNEAFEVMYKGYANLKDIVS